MAGVSPPTAKGQDMTTSLEDRFDAAMMDIYRRAKAEARYNATRFFQMLTDHRGLETARILLHSDTVSEGYTALWERGRLDLTVEALIHDHPEFHPLFSNDEQEIARRRLVEYRYAPALEDNREQASVLRYSMKQASKVGKENPF
jgi:hypothetical protein